MSTLTIDKPAKNYLFVRPMDEVKYSRLRACDRATITVMDNQDRVALLEVYGCNSNEKSLAKIAHNYINGESRIKLTNLKRRKLLREGKIRSVYTVNDMNEMTIF